MLFGSSRSKVTTIVSRKISIVVESQCLWNVYHSMYLKSTRLNWLFYSEPKLPTCWFSSVVEMKASYIKKQKARTLKLVQDEAVKRFLGYSSIFRWSRCFNFAHRTLFKTRSCFIVQRGQRPTWPLVVATVIISLLVSSLSTVEKVYTHDIYLRHAHWHQIV